ncbi:hypothetical protein GZL_06937 [Streptomyces sp. 769]|nr:hypothetical protein GZL_06937 [Streptomyces sp. 769]
MLPGPSFLPEVDTSLPQRVAVRTAITAVTSVNGNRFLNPEGRHLSQCLVCRRGVASGSHAPAAAWRAAMPGCPGHGTAAAQVHGPAAEAAVDGGGPCRGERRMLCTGGYMRDLIKHRLLLRQDQLRCLDTADSVDGNARRPTRRGYQGLHQSRAAASRPRPTPRAADGPGRTKHRSWTASTSSSSSSASTRDAGGKDKHEGSQASEVGSNTPLPIRHRHLLIPSRTDRTGRSEAPEKVTIRPRSRRCAAGTGAGADTSVPLPAAPHGKPDTARPHALSLRTRRPAATADEASVCPG